MGAVANHTATDPDGRVNVHAIKKHLLLFMACVTLFNLSKPQFELIIGRMGLMADCTVSLLNRVMDV